MRVLCLIFMLFASVVGTNYYFDNTNGLDANSGLSEVLAKKTISSFNNLTVADGDSVLFKRGEIWYGTRAIPKNGGTSGYIYISSYGDESVPLPIISAGRIVSGTGFEWRLSSNGINEYYLTLTGGTDPSVTSRPMPIWVNDEALDTATIGSLLDHQYNWGDNDGLGFSTIYLRLDAGDPDVTGDTIVTIKEQNALYASTKSNLHFSNIHLKHGSGDIVRYLTSTNIVFDKCVFSHSNQGFKFETVTNSTLKSCQIKYIWNSTYNGVYFLTNATGNKIVNSLIYDCGGYGILIASGSNTDLINCTVVKTRLAGFRSTSTADCNVTNSIFSACGFGNQQIVQKGGTGAVSVKNCSMLDGMKFDLDMINGCTDLGGNIYDYAKFVKEPNVGFVCLRLDDWVYGGDAQANFRAFTDSLAARGLTTKMSWNLSQTDLITPADWTEITAFKNAGHDIGMHTRGHVDISSKNAFTIRYTGSGATCVLNVSIDFENRTGTISSDCSDDADDFIYTLSGTDFRLGDPANSRAGIISTIDALANYTCSIDKSGNYNAKSICIADVQNQDIKTANYVHPLDINRFYTEEIKNCRDDVRNGIGATDITYAYSLGPYDSQVIDSIISFGNILSTSTVSPTSSTLLKSIKMHEMSCLGYSEFQGANSTIWRIKAQSLAAMMASWGGAMCVLTHGTSDTKADSLAYYAQVINAMESRCHIGSQMEATQWIIANGQPLNDRMYRVYQPDSSDFRIKSTSPCVNSGDKTAITGIPNLYTLDGIKLTDGDGSVLVDSINIGAYGTFNNNTPPTLTSITPTSGKIGDTIRLIGTNLIPEGTVKIGNTDMSILSISSSGDTLKSIIPNVPYGLYNISVTSPEGSDTLQNAFRVVHHKSNLLIVRDTTSTPVFEINQYKSKCWLDISNTSSGPWNPIDSIQGEAGTVDTLQGVAGKYHRGRCVTIP